MAKESPFPVISVEGSPYEMGYQYGSRCRKLINGILEMYRVVLKESANLEWEQVRGLSEKFIPFIEEYDPDAVDEMRGIAKGVDAALEEIAAINARSELAYAAMTREAVVDAQSMTCTALAAIPEATRNNHTLIGQNWDWYTAAQRSFIILKKKKKGKPNCVSFVEAGLLGKGGMNSAGLGFVGNGLATDKMQFGVPTNIITNKILSAESIAEVIGMMLSARRAGATNRLTAAANGECVDIELANDDYNVIFPEDGLIAHTNHFTVYKPTIRDTLPAKWPNTLTRLYRARKLLAAERGDITLDTFKRIFTDHLGRPTSICWHADERVDEAQRIQTNASVMMDLNEGALYIAKGPPCENGYVSLDLQDIL